MLFWPVTMLIGKRKVLWSQWLLMISMTLISLTHILYACLFNSFLKNEYLLLVMYMVFALYTPLMTMVSVAYLTHPKGVSLRLRASFLPATVASILLALSVAIGGADMYRLWIERGSDAVANVFFPHSWRYNLIVACHYYMFWIVLSAEVVWVFLYSVVHIRRFNAMLGEYFTQGQHGPVMDRKDFFIVVTACIFIIIHLFLFPFNAPRHFSSTVIYCVVFGTSAFLLGRLIYRLNYSAALLNENISQSSRYHTEDLSDLGKQMARYVEEEAFLNPDLSVFEIARHFRVSQDRVVDAIHEHTSTTFAEYVDSLRVERAAALLTQADGIDDPELITHIAHRCGYLSAQALESAFLRVMNTPISQSGLV